MMKIISFFLILFFTSTVFAGSVKHFACNCPVSDNDYKKAKACLEKCYLTRHTNAIVMDASARTFMCLSYSCNEPERKCSASFNKVAFKVGKGDQCRQILCCGD